MLFTLCSCISPSKEGLEFRFVCLEWRVGRDNETDYEKKEFLDYEVESDLATVSRYKLFLLNNLS